MHPNAYFAVDEDVKPDKKIVETLTQVNVYVVFGSRNEKDCQCPAGGLLNLKFCVFLGCTVVQSGVFPPV